MKKQQGIWLSALCASVLLGANTSFAEHKPDHNENKDHKEHVADEALCQNNNCKGHAECAGFGNDSCAGANSCKGKGSLKAANEAECTTKKGIWHGKKAEAKKNKKG